MHLHSLVPCVFLVLCGSLLASVSFMCCLPVLSTALQDTLGHKGDYTGPEFDELDDAVKASMEAYVASP